MVDVVTGILTALLWLFGVTIVLLLGVFVYFQKQFKINIAYKDFTKGGQWVFEKAREQKDVLDDTLKWKLQRTKKVIIPTPTTTYHNNKGQAVGLFYRHDEDTFIPIKDNATPESLSKNTEFMKSFDPFPTEQKAIFLQQARKNERWKKEGLSSMLLKAFPYVAIIMLIAINLILLPDVLQAKAVASEQAERAGDSWKEAANAWDELTNDKSTIGLDQDNPTNGGAPPY